MTRDEGAGDATAVAGARRARTAAACVTAEGVALVGFAVWIWWESTRPQTSASAAGNGRLEALYLGPLGLIVLALAVGLWRRSGIAYGAVVAVQVLALPIAWTMLQAGFVLGALPLFAVALTCLWSLLSAPGRAAFGR